jgi:hypothetical protein
MPVLWLYTREGVFDSEDAHRKSRLPLTVCWSDAKAGDFLKRHEQNCSEKQLGKRNFFREPSTYSQHLKHSEKKVRPWKTLHHCSCATAGQAAPALRWCLVGSSHVCHEQTCSPQGVYTAWLLSGGQGCHWPLTRKITLNGFTSF